MHGRSSSGLLSFTHGGKAAKLAQAGVSNREAIHIKGLGLANKSSGVGSLYNNAGRQRRTWLK